MGDAQVSFFVTVALESGAAIEVRGLEKDEGEVAIMPAEGAFFMPLFGDDPFHYHPGCKPPLCCPGSDKFCGAVP